MKKTRKKPSLSPAQKKEAIAKAIVNIKNGLITEFTLNKEKDNEFKEQEFTEFFDRVIKPILEGRTPAFCERGCLSSFIWDLTLIVKSTPITLKTVFLDESAFDYHRLKQSEVRELAEVLIIETENETNARESKSQQRRKHSDFKQKKLMRFLHVATAFKCSKNQFSLLAIAISQHLTKGVARTKPTFFLPENAGLPDHPSESKPNITCSVNIEMIRTKISGDPQIPKQLNLLNLFDFNNNPQTFKLFLLRWAAEGVSSLYNLVQSPPQSNSSSSPSSSSSSSSMSLLEQGGDPQKDNAPELNLSKAQLETSNKALKEFLEKKLTTAEEKTQMATTKKELEHILGQLSEDKIDADLSPVILDSIELLAQFPNFHDPLLNKYSSLIKNETPQKIEERERKLVATVSKIKALKIHRAILELTINLRAIRIQRSEKNNAQTIYQYHFQITYLQRIIFILREERSLSNPNDKIINDLIKKKLNHYFNCLGETSEKTSQYEQHPDLIVRFTYLSIQLSLAQFHGKHKQLVNICKDIIEKYGQIIEDSHRNMFQRLNHKANVILEDPRYLQYQPDKQYKKRKRDEIPDQETKLEFSSQAAAGSRKSESSEQETLRAGISDQDLLTIITTQLGPDADSKMADKYLSEWYGSQFPLSNSSSLQIIVLDLFLVGLKARLFSPSEQRSQVPPQKERYQQGAPALTLSLPSTPHPSPLLLVRTPPPAVAKTFSLITLKINFKTALSQIKGECHFPQSLLDHLDTVKDLNGLEQFYNEILKGTEGYFPNVQFGKADESFKSFLRKELKIIKIWREQQTQLQPKIPAVSASPPFSSLQSSSALFGLLPAGNPTVLPSPASITLGNPS